MKRAMNCLAWGAVFLTIVVIIFTLSAGHYFINEYYFQNYSAVQWCMFLTMILWSIKVLSWKETSKYKFYSAFCLLIAAGTAFFIYNNIN